MGCQVHYGPSPIVPDEGTAQVWRFGDQVRTVRQGDLLIKSASGFNGDRELAHRCQEIWKDLGYSGHPSSPAAFFHEEFPTPRVNWTVNNTLRRYFHGGWMEAFDRGHVPGPLYLYDINKAYRWAGSQPLPMDLRPKTPDDDRFIGILRRTGGPESVPWFFRRERVLCTNRDVELYDLQGELEWAITWDSVEDSVGEHLEQWEEVLPPEAFDHLCRSYWGRWGSTEPVVQQTVKDGKVTSSHQLYNRFAHLPWAVMVVHRIIRKVYRESLIYSHSVCVDSVIRSKRMPTGDAPGEWSLEEEIGPDGIFIRGPGVWTRAPAEADPQEWDRHSGYGPNASARWEEFKGRHGMTAEAMLKAWEDQW